MKKTRIVGRIIAGAVASAFLLGSLAAPAQADSGWTKVKSDERVQTNDSGWTKVG
jgi:hypothetical protein